MARYSQIKAEGYNSEDASKLNDVVAALKVAGIIATDSQGQLRNFGVVIDELMPKWSGLDENTKRYIATTLGGTYQLNRFITLMENSDDSFRNYEIALSAAGTAQQKFDIYMESNAAKVNVFKSTMEQLWLNTFNSESFGKIIEFGTGFVQLVDNIGLANLAMIAISVTMIVFSKNIMKSLIAVKNFIVGLSAMNFTLAAINPWITIIVVALGLLALGYMNVSSASERFEESIDRQSKKFNEQKQSIDNLSQSLNTLNKADNALISSSTDLYDIFKQIKDINPDIVNGMNLQTASVNDLKNALSLASTEALKAKRDMLALSAAEAYRNYKTGTVNEPFFDEWTNTWISMPKKISEEEKKKWFDIFKSASQESAVIGNQLGENFEDEIIKNKRLVKKSSKNNKPNDNSSPSSPSPPNLSDILTEEQKLQNSIVDAENKSKNLLNEEYETRKNNLDLEEKEQKALLDYYETQRGVAKSKGLQDELDEKILGVQAQLASIEKERKEINKDIAEISKKTFEDQQKSLEDLTKTQIDLEKKVAEQQLKNDLQRHQDKIDDYEAENDLLQDKIDDLKREADLEDDIAKTRQYQLDITKAEERLANVQKEKNVYMYTGNGDTGWEWVANPEEVQQATEDLLKLQEDYNQYQRDLELKYREQALQDQIKANQDKIEEEKKTMDTLKENFDLAWQDIDLIFETRMADLKITQDSNLDKMITSAQEKMAQLKAIYAEMVGGQPSPPSSSSPSSSSSSMNFTDGLSQEEKDYLVDTGKITPDMGDNWQDIEDKIKDGTITINGYASGTDSSSEELSLVGEQGAELKWLDKGTKILPSDLSQKLLNLPNLMTNFLNINTQTPQFSMSCANGGGTNNSPIYNIKIDQVVTPNSKAFMQELNNRVALTT
jgi:hypothetical protein